MTRYKKLLVLLDLTEDSEQVAEAGREMAQSYGAQIVALHVVESVPVDSMVTLPTPNLQSELIDHAQEDIVEIARRCGLSHAKCRNECGNIKAEILRVADEEDVDLVALGSRERHGLAILMNFTEHSVLHVALRPARRRAHMDFPRARTLSSTNPWCHPIARPPTLPNMIAERYLAVTSFSCF